MTGDDDAADTMAAPGSAESYAAPVFAGEPVTSAATPASAALQQVSFLTGVNQNGTLTNNSFWGLNGGTSRKWGSSGTAGTSGGTVTYSFDPTSNFTATERATFVRGFALWSAVANIQFSETTNGSAANVLLRRGTDGGAYQSDQGRVTTGSGSTLGLHTGQALISIDTRVTGFDLSGSFDVIGGYGFQTVAHEIGHLLGLGHGGNYNGNVDPSTQQFGPYDDRSWTMMSYIYWGSSNPKYKSSYELTGTNWGTTPDRYQRQSTGTWMPLDILAIQQIYGTAVSTPLSGGQVYGFNSNIIGAIAPLLDFTFNKHPVVTIWNKGTNNTLDLSGFTASAIVNLSPGSFSSVDGQVNNIAIAYGTTVETAIGGSGNDTFVGSDANNVFAGGAGRDTYTGGLGADTYRDTATNLSGDTITDFSGSDRIIITDAVANGLTFSYANNVLSYKLTSTGPAYTINITNSITGPIVMSTESSGGISLRVGQPLANYVKSTITGRSLVGYVEPTAIGPSLNAAVMRLPLARTDGSPGRADTLLARSTSDFVSYAGAKQGVIVDLGCQLTWDGAYNDALKGFENAIGSSTADALVGDGDNNVFDGFGGADTIQGGTGSDTVSFASTPRGVIVDLVSQLTWDGVNNAFLQSIENAIGSSAADLLVGDDGNNVFDGFGGADTIQGGAGSDTVSFASASRGVSVDLRNQSASDGLANTVLRSIENAIGSSSADLLVGDDGDNLFDGFGGADTIQGGAGSDTVSFISASRGVGVDLRNQSASNNGNTIVLQNIENAIGSSFADLLVGDDGDNLFDGFGGADTIQGGAGSDTVSFISASRGVSVDLRNQSASDGLANTVLQSIENAIGSSFADLLVGDGGDNVFDGFGGADTIQGGAGSDTVSFASASRGVIVDLGSQLTWDGTNNAFLQSIENAIGSSAADLLVGDDGDNVFDGLGGADTIRGGAGSDTVSFASASRGVIVDLGSQLTWDGVNNAFLQSIENATGSRYDDVIMATSSRSGSSNGTLAGNGGSDTFLFGSAGFQFQVITDFTTSKGAASERDTIAFASGLIADDDLLASAVEYSDGVLLNASGQDKVFLANVHLADLSAADFKLA